MTVKDEIEGLNEAQAIRRLAIAVDELTDELKSVRTLLTTIGLLLFGSMVSLIGVFLTLILQH